MERISIIVPIYNVAIYLKKCLDSILSQSYANIEILLVNDGSTDHSATICRSYAQQDARIKYYEKRNGGLSDARNYGLDKATGKYVIFVDSDDFISEDFIMCLYTALIRQNADIAMSNYDKVDEKGETVDTISFPLKQEVISGRDLCRKLLEADGNAFVVAWNKLYKRELFNNIRFEKDKLHEDEYIAYNLLYHVPKIALVHQELYHYLERDNSITTSRMTEKRLFCLLEFQHNRMSFYHKQQDMILLKASQSYFLSFIIQFVSKYDKTFITKPIKKMLYRNYVEVYKEWLKDTRQVSIAKRIYYFIAYCNLDSAVLLKKIIH